MKRGADAGGAAKKTRRLSKGVAAVNRRWICIERLADVSLLQGGVFVLLLEVVIGHCFITTAP